MAALDNGFGNFQGWDQISGALRTPELASPNGSAGGGGGGSNIIAPTDPVPENIRNMFAATQQARNTTFNSHPIIVMLIAFMKNKYNDYQWKSRQLRDTIFTGYDSSAAPDSFSADVGVDQNTLKPGTVGLIIKALYNSQGWYDEHIDIDKANGDITSLNTYISPKKPDLLMQYYRHKFSVTASDDSVKQYKHLLLSKAYRTLKQLQAGQGTWTDPDLEMFNHFMKLQACGASQPDIDAVWHTLTETEPKLDGSSFPQISPGKWRGYDGWIGPGSLDYQDLKATNLDSSQTSPPMAGPTGFFPPSIITLVESYVSWAGYWKSAPSSSCLSDDAMILMADGQARRIKDIEAGDDVASASMLTGQGLVAIGAAKVAFVSRPRRAGRSLYSLNAFPGIKFTATHPLVHLNKPDDNRGRYSIAFVDPLLAVSLNPTWRSCDYSRIFPEQVVEHKATSNDDEILYDLILDLELPRTGLEPSEMPSYVVVDQYNNPLTILSEAPNVKWYTLDYIFFCGMLQGINHEQGEIRLFLDHLASSKSRARSVLQSVARQHLTGSSAMVSYEHMTPLSVHLQHTDNGQQVADLLEGLVARLGDVAGWEVLFGWAKVASAPPEDEKDSMLDVLFLQSLHVLGDRIESSASTLDLHAIMAGPWKLQIRRAGVLLAEQALGAVIQGSSTLKIQDTAELGTSATSADQKQDLEVMLVGKNACWHGRGMLCPEVNSQLVMSRIIGTYPDMQAVETPAFATLQLEFRQILRRVYDARSSWTADKMQQYAYMLGQEYLPRILTVIRELP